MIVLDCEQGSEVWKNARLCIPTSSRFKEIVTSKGVRSKQRTKYLYQKAGEIVTGEPSDQYTNSYMNLGTEREDEARRDYEWQNDVEIRQVGFCFYNDKKEFGASPDGLIGESGGFENKNAIPSVQLERLEKGWEGTEHKAQVQGNLLTFRREWWDLQSYSRGLRSIVVRFERDEEFIKNLLIEIKMFNREAKLLAEKWRVN